MPATRTRVITYGAFSTSTAGFYLDAVDSIDFDERSFRIAFDVILRFSTADALTAAESTMRQQLSTRNLALQITSEGTTKWHFVDGTGTVLAGQEGAEFIKPSLTSLGTHRTAKSSAYRVVVEVTRSGVRSSAPGILRQSARTTELPNGIRRLNFRATFTPGPSSSESGTAEDRFADATYGFDALASAVTSTLTGTWERDGNLSKSFDTDDHPNTRTLTASANFRELIFAQSSRAVDDPDLVGASYDVVVNRGSAFSIPGEQARPLTAVTVLFRSGVIKSNSDPATLIDAVVLPYCQNVVSERLGVLNAKEINHTLRHDPTNNTISGQVFYLAEASIVLELSKQVSDNARNGVNLIPVLDGKKWTRDKWTGPGSWTRRVTLGARVLGLNVVSTLDRLEQAEITAASSAGFYFTGWAVAGSPSAERFEDAGNEIVTTVETRTLIFERADIRNETGTQAQSSSIESAGGGGAFLESFRERS